MARSRSSLSLDDFPAVGLHQLEQRAALLKRTDNKYVLGADAIAELLHRLAGDHAALEIDGTREFSYQSVYFDTPELRCFHDHVESRAPRFKARTRLYRDSGQCVFEVKLKRSDGDTDKQQVEHAPDAAFRLDERARECLRSALSRCRLPVPEQLSPTLRTTFTRITLVPAHGGDERTTVDQRIVLERTGGGRARLRNGLVVVEAKSEDGESLTDRVLTEMGVEPQSLSKYRTGIALLAPELDDPESRRGSQRYFSVEG